ncbi:MAG: ATP-binding protein, partial [Clostridiales bacterium]|nr:ATP-binding protein [Clostridiales bacterium]
MKKRWIILMTVILAVILGISYNAYNIRITKIMYDESVSQLTAVYTQVGKTYYSLAMNNWKVLASWGSSIADMGSDEEVAEYLKGQQETWEITDFYFLDENGNYITLSGETGTLDLGDRLEYLIDDVEPIVVDGRFEDGSVQTIFATPADNLHTYGGLNYCALACGFTKEYMANELAIDAFSGMANCYIINGDDGRVLFTNASSGNESEFFQDFMAESGSFDDAQIEQVMSALAEQDEGSLEYTKAGKDCYMIYMSIGFRNWMMVGTVPRSAVGEHFDQIQRLTAILFIAICVCVALIIIVVIVNNSSQKLGKKSLDLQYREQLFDILTNSVDDVFFMFSRQPGASAFTAEYVSPSTERLLGIPAADIKNDIHRLWILYERSGADIKYTGPEKIEEIKPGTYWQGETRLKNEKTGDTHWYSETLYHVSITGSEKFVFVLSDRTSEKSKNEALTEALDIAESANEAKSNFLFNMSHDIRTPMNAIVGYASLLEKDANEPEKVREYTEKISASSHHLLGIINDILDMSKIESGKTRLDMEEFDIAELIGELESVLMPQARARGQNFEISTESLRKEVLMGDQIRLSQILINLVSNAIKYTPEGGNILLEITDKSRESDRFAKLRFKVQDDGIGMSEEFLKTVYDPFVRARNTTVSKIQGTGLGLAITKNLVELMGGTISVESAEGKGTTFIVNIDFRVVRNESETREMENKDTDVADADEASIEGLSFLVAEDNEINAELIEELLEDEGAKCDLAEDGKQALDKFTSSAPGTYDVILMDVQMPVMDGYAATRAIRASGHPDASSIPIAAMTANAFAEDVANALAAGMNAHLAKPIDMRLVKSTVVRLVGERK